MFKNMSKSNKFLGVAGIVFLLSMLTVNTLIFTATFTVFIVAVVMNVYQMLKRNSLDEITEYNDKQIEQDMEEKKYLSAGVRIIALPMCAVGVFFAGLQLVIMWVSCF